MTPPRRKAASCRSNPYPIAFLSILNTFAHVMDIESLRQFFLCWLIIDLIFYMITVTAVIFASNWVTGLQAKLFKVSQETACEMLYRYVAFFKLFIIVFNFGPWLALVLMK